ncbi:MAG TPA: CHAD domain-containing protein, partial [Vicinamibacterales bacterium]|nr:CHAD domain-containing protein [Vicinamibacterales bacterium]
MRSSVDGKATAGFRRRVDAFTSELVEALEGDSTAIHRTRVASRRLREAISGAAFEQGEGKSLRDEVRAVAKALGPVREIDVTLRTLHERHPNGAQPSVAIDALSRHVTLERVNARKRLSRTLTAGKLQRLARKLSSAAAGLETREDVDGRKFSRTWQWVADARLARRASALSEAIEQAGTIYAPAMLHTVRIAVKKFRYAFELAAEARPIPRAAQHLATLKT